MEVRSVPYQEPFRNETKGPLERTNVKHGLFMRLDQITLFFHYFVLISGQSIWFLGVQMEIRMRTASTRQYSRASPYRAVALSIIINDS